MGTQYGRYLVMAALLLGVGTGCHRVNSGGSAATDRAPASAAAETARGEAVDLTAGRVYACRHADGPIVLDGKLDESAWQRAQRVEKFQVYRPGGEHAFKTVARLTWDDTCLYVSFECTDDDIRAASGTHDDYLAAGDVVELYIKYGDEHGQYYEMVSAPNGTTFDARWPRRGAGDYKQWTPWESGMRSVVKVRGTVNKPGDTDTGYTVETAVPWSAFDGFETPPAIATVWTFGLFRYDHGESFSEPCLTMSLAESPEHGFHYYEAYHPIVFER